MRFLLPGLGFSLVLSGLISPNLAAVAAPLPPVVPNHVLKIAQQPIDTNTIRGNGVEFVAPSGFQGQAVDIEGIKRQVMRNAATPASSLVSPLIFPQITQIQRLPFDIAAANKLMDEAGYPRVGGETGTRFEGDLDCPNDRYVNDEAICTSIVSMLARIGVRVTLAAPMA